jgi:hypothetical protein
MKSGKVKIEVKRMNLSASRVVSLAMARGGVEELIAAIEIWFCGILKSCIVDNNFLLRFEPPHT